MRFSVRIEASCGQETMGSLRGSTFGGPGGVVGTGCTMEDRTGT